MVPLDNFISRDQNTFLSGDYLNMVMSVCNKVHLCFMQKTLYICIATTKQNKTKQNKTKQNKTKQNKTKQNKTKQNKTKQNKTRAKHDYFSCALN